ncbi:uncharacterized protein LOC141851934 [Brevipalpus obovatus]|uniref:uncharacterized protein LOC141851934 n=1 Tax=Brevipalpus obovatus TaxID=246614 RepID=UPI003D9F9211
MTIMDKNRFLMGVSLMLAIVGLEAIVLSNRDLKTLCKLSSELVLTGMDEYDTASVLEQTVEENYGPKPNLTLIDGMKNFIRDAGNRTNSNATLTKRVHFSPEEDLMLRQLVNQMTDNSVRDGRGTVNNYYPQATIMKMKTIVNQKKGSLTVMNTNMAAGSSQITSTGVSLVDVMNKNVKGTQKFSNIQVQTGPGLRLGVGNLLNGLNITDLARGIVPSNLTRKLVDTNIERKKQGLPIINLRDLINQAGHANQAAKASKRTKRDTTVTTNYKDYCDDLIFPLKMNSTDHDEWLQGLLAISDQVLTLRKIRTKPHNIVRTIKGAVLEERNGRIFPQLNGIRFGLKKR